MASQADLSLTSNTQRPMRPGEVPQAWPCRANERGIEHAGVVHQNIEAPSPVDRNANHVFDLPLRSKVNYKRLALRPGLPSSFCGRIESMRVCVRDGDSVRPLACLASVVQLTLSLGRSPGR